MKKIVSILLLTCSLASCSKMGTTRVKNLIDLTPKLEVEVSKNHLLSTGIENPFKQDKTKSYTISKAKIIGQPAIAKGMMYSVDAKGYVTAFSLKTKKIVWTQDIAELQMDRRFNSGGVLFSDGKLYVTHGTRNLIVLDAENGHEIIRKEFPDALRTKPIMVNDALIIVQTVSNQLLAYDTKTSKMKWMHEGGIETISSENQVHPAIHNGNVFASYSSGEVFYLNAIDGSEIWRYNLTNTDDIGLPSFEPAVVVTKPIFAGNVVYFATSNGKIVKLDVAQGKEIWVKTADDVQSMILRDGNLIVTNNARQVALLSSSNGNVFWVGNLISNKDRNSKKPKPALFLDPFVFKDGENYTINVISSVDELYQFQTNELGYLPSEPKIIPIAKNIKYYWISCCNGGMHLISDRTVSF